MTASALSVPSERRLAGLRLALGRGLYFLLLALCLLVFAVSQYAIYTIKTSPCDSIYNASWEACDEWFATIAGLGLTASGFEMYFVVLRMLAAVPFFGLSLVLVWQHGRQLRVLLLAGLLLVLGTAGTWFNPLWEWAGGWFENSSALPRLAWLANLLSFLLYSGLLLFVYLFPNGHFYPRWARYLAVFWVVYLFTFTFFLDWGVIPPVIYTLAILLAVGTAIYAVLARYRWDADPVQRQQIKWVVAGVLLLAANYLLDFIVFNLYPLVTGEYPLTTGAQAMWWELIQDTLWFSSQFLFALCIGLAVFRHRLWDIDLLLNRALVYAGLTGGIVMLYVLIVGGMGALFQTQGSLWISLLATGVIAVLFQPARERLQRGVNRLLYGLRDEPEVVLSQLARQLENSSASEDILETLVQTVAAALKIPHAAIWLPDESGESKPVAAWGSAPDRVQHIPLVLQKETLGELVVAPRSTGESFSPGEQALLATIARFTATTVRAVQLSQELHHSREQIVLAREEERRRLRRDLHDGLGPQLASQTLGMNAARKLIPKDPHKAAEILETLIGQAQEAILDVRRLVYELRPPALDELGLAGALQESAARYETPDLTIHCQTPNDLPELPAAVEVAAYRIVQEALTNVVRHAQATRAAVVLDISANQLELSVTDNGRGLPDELRSGIGLQSMRERAAELNGSITIGPAPHGGTQIQARLPLEG